MQNHSRLTISRLETQLPANKSLTPRRLLVCLALSLLIATSAPAWAQTTWHVNDDAPNDPAPGDPTVSDPLEDGSPEHPFDAIQEAIDASVDTDTVLIANGTYMGEGCRDLDFGGRAIVVRSENGPETCVIDCDNKGRGFYFHSGEVADSIVEGLTITNGIDSNGGGVCCIYNSSPMLTGCTISGNSAYDSGGGVFCSSSSPTLTNCRICGNSARYDGGGVYYSSGNTRLINCTISGNSADNKGGGVCVWHGNPTLTNCTISGNSACDYGGGVYCYSSSPTLTNCILWGDTPQEIYGYSGSPAVTYCNVQGGWTGEGNILVDPQFAFADDFHLSLWSPCIDKGTNDPPGGLPAGDLDGNIRPLDGNGGTEPIADMGAFEVNAAAPSIALSQTGFKFYASEGGSDPTEQTLLLRNCSVGLLNWEITGQPAWLTVMPLSGESSWNVEQVSLSANISGLPHGAYAAVLEVVDPQAVNSPRKVLVTLYVSTTLYVPGEYSTIQAAIDATIPGDIVELADDTYTGAGNKDLDFGGKAITVRSASGDPGLCIIDCGGDGRGFFFSKGEGEDSIIDGLAITNGSDNGGAGVCCCGSSPTLTNCTISRNSSNHEGGGVYCYSSSPTLTNCTISRNSSNDEGGGVYCHDSSPTLTNCTISGNSSNDEGGGVYCHDSSPTLTNCILWGDTPQEVYVPWGNPAVSYCNVQGGWDGAGNIDADPLFVDPDGPDDDPNTWEDNDYRLAPHSPCADAGDNAAVPSDEFDLDGDDDTDEPLPFDLDGNPRFVDDPTVVDTGVGAPPIVDMGAYEYILGDVDRDGDVDLSDLADLLGRYGACVGDTVFHVATDFDADGCIGLSDLACLLGRYGWGA